jgi:hypothetical protein
MPESAMTTEPPATAPLSSDRRFLVALSFPGEHRQLVGQIAAALVQLLGGQERVFYDKYFEEELARENLAFYLQDIYQEKAELLVIFLCSCYVQKNWCGLEWRAIQDLMAGRNDRPDRMFLRIHEGKVPGFFHNIDGYLDVEGKTPDDLAASIVKRLRLALAHLSGLGGAPAPGGSHVPVKAPPPGKQDTDTAVQGLAALSDLLTSPAVQEAVTEYQEELSESSNRINNLTRYKAVHDHLHSLQVHCYRPVLEEFRRFPEKPVDWDQLEEYGNNLENVVLALDEATGEDCFSETEQDKLKSTVKTLQRSRTDLASAIKQKDLKQLKTAAQGMLSVLRNQPDYFSISLGHLARELHLERLAQAMRGLHQKLRGQFLDPDKLAQFGAGTEALERLGKELIQLIDNHDRWQEFDSTLRLVEGDPEMIEQLRQGTWEDLKVKSQRLNSGGEESWEAEIREKTDELDVALQTQPADKFFFAFQKYRNWVVQRFYRVDRDLLKLCAKLCRVGVPLDTILGRDQ